MATGPTVAIIGATGKTGKWALKGALQRNYQVRVLARSPKKLEPLLAEIFPEKDGNVTELMNKITIVEGSVTDHGKVVELCSGARVVMSFLGMVNPPEWIVKPGVEAIIKALRAISAGGSIPPKFLSMSSIGLSESRSQANTAWCCCIVWLTVDKLLKECFADMQAAEDYIVDNREGLNITIVRASILGDKEKYLKDFTDDHTKSHKLVGSDEHQDLTTFVDRQHVAEGFLDLCETGSWNNSEVSVFDYVKGEARVTMERRVLWGDIFTVLFLCLILATDTIPGMVQWFATSTNTARHNIEAMRTVYDYVLLLEIFAATIVVIISSHFLKGESKSMALYSSVLLQWWVKFYIALVSWYITVCSFVPGPAMFVVVLLLALPTVLRFGLLRRNWRGAEGGLLRLVRVWMVVCAVQMQAWADVLSYRASFMGSSIKLMGLKMDYFAEHPEWPVGSHSPDGFQADIVLQQAAASEQAALKTLCPWWLAVLIICAQLAVVHCVACKTFNALSEHSDEEPDDAPAES